jgi:hypothetical protein
MLSFISVEPQSRVLLESHTNTLLAQFNTQLRIIADRYLAFFQERSIDLLQVFHLTLIIQSSGGVLRQPSQFCAKHQIPSILTNSFKVLILYRTSIARQKLLMPHLTLVLNQPQQEQHGIK